MKAFHTLWTKPKGTEHIEEFEFLTMVLSALKWQQKNGEIYLVTDSLGEKFIKSRGAESCWNGIITTLDNIPDRISPKTFWAAGKIFALDSFKAPVVSIDNDFIVWENLNLENYRPKLSVIHKEELNPFVYPNKDFLKEFDKGYDWTVKPSNTAFVYYGDEELKETYKNLSLEVMSTLKSDDTLVPMVFAEQRLLSMIANKMGMRVDTFSTLKYLQNGDRRFTHLWGYKEKLKNNPPMKEEFTKRLQNKIKTEFF